VSMTLSQILSLVGKLDDSPGEDTPKERFRRFLRENILEIGQVRDYIEGCLRNSGDQYSRALQDLINYIGYFLKFDIIFGRYQGTSGQIGFDGHWKSSTGFHIVVEVKTSEVYAVKTATLMDYVNRLISEREIPTWNEALGLYVVGRPDPDIRTLENAIVAEKKSDQLRIISADSLLSLAEMMNEYDVSHEDILAVIKPSGPTIDPIVSLMARLAAEPIIPNGDNEVVYWLTPVRSDEEQTAEECIQTLVEQERIYAFGERTPGRKYIKPGDWICFYATAKGVVAHAKVASKPDLLQHPKVRHSDKYPWVFRLEDIHLYLNEPVVIDATMRNQLDGFQGRDPNKRWAWYVQATRKISAHDFGILTRGQFQK